MNSIQSSRSPGVVTHNRNNIKISANNNNSNSAVDVEHGGANLAIYIRNLCKSYGKGAPVLQNLCMNVRKGTIYGLLGGSGCGKTTVLSCIVGLQKWDSGEVQVFGHRPGTKESGIPGKRLGYMPQDLALYTQLSIYEMIRYYGKLFNMTAVEITERWLFLVKLLKLPSKFKLIGQLSGGQKRRTSLALALIHCPELLVLDEPTVGLDPLLRRSIWNHLYKIVSTLNTTIIITTHYIEEARLSNTIGIMRNGRLLVEDNPTTLLLSYECDLLEDVVLQLCRKDEKSIKNSEHKNKNASVTGVSFKSSWKEDGYNVVGEKELDGIFRKAVGFDCSLNENLRRKSVKRQDSILLKMRDHPIYESIQRVQGLTTVMLMTFIRFPIFIAIILLLPTIHGSLTLLTIGRNPIGMRLGVVNGELSNWTSECDAEIHQGNSCDFSALSCKYINQVKKGSLFDLIPYDSAEDALAQAHQGYIYGYLQFPTNFSQHTIDFATAKYFATNESLEGSRVYTRLDMSQYVGGIYMIRNLYASYQDYMKQLAVSCKIGGQAAEVPLKFRDPVYGKVDDEFKTFLMPGVIISCTFGILCVLTAIILISDCKQGTLSRARVAGLNTVEVMLSHFLTQSVVGAGQIALWTIILHYGFGLEVLGSSILYFVIAFLCGMCGTGLGMLIGIICTDEVEAMIFGVFICPVLLIFGGVFWPLDGMPLIVRYIAYCLPTTLSVESLRSVIVRALGFTHGFVYPGIAVLVIWIVLFAIVDAICFKKFVK